MNIFEENTKASFDIRGNERSLSRFDKVKVYRNLNKPEYFSIVAMNGIYKNKVVAYGKSVTLVNATFKVSLKSRQRALKAKTRNVHAWCIGNISALNHCAIEVDGKNVTYQPFVRDDFHYVESKESVANRVFQEATLQGSNVIV